MVLMVAGAVGSILAVLGLTVLFSRLDAQADGPELGGAHNGGAPGAGS